MIPYSLRTSVRAVSALAFALVAACSNDARRGNGRHTNARDSTGVNRAATGTANGSVDLGKDDYEVVALTAVGRVSGQITFGSASVDTAAAMAGAANVADSAFTPAADTAAIKCVEPARSRASRRVRLSSIVLRKGARPSDILSPSAVVWVAGVTKGKAISEDKRADLASENCTIDPRVLAVSVGTTVNVENDDKALHTLVFTRSASHDTLTKMSFFNTGEVVASERLAKTPGIVDVTCVQHPWTRSSIAVFAHPYFAVTDPSGRFSIDSLPPGTYTVMVWAPGLVRPKEQQVSVTAGGAATVDLDLGSAKT
ncbi:MAG TPA: carboxypeptidase regulatory-like domain-containing protein [Gemmatimonadaceae bacterium]|nr:carboxypeptidase regulatory-like domain-containing protein [Gemmatimonadaceae bacterium]